MRISQRSPVIQNIINSPIIQFRGSLTANDYCYWLLLPIYKRSSAVTDQFKLLLLLLLLLVKAYSCWLLTAAAAVTLKTRQNLVGIFIVSLSFNLFLPSDRLQVSNKIFSY